MKEEYQRVIEIQTKGGETLRTVLFFDSEEQMERCTFESWFFDRLSHEGGMLPYETSDVPANIMHGRISIDAVSRVHEVSFGPTF